MDLLSPFKSIGKRSYKIKLIKKMSLNDLFTQKGEIVALDFSLEAGKTN
jgi:hypothetical protein